MSLILEASILTLLRFGLPFLAWIVLFWDWITGRITILLDTLNNYAFFKFFYNNLYEGVIPLWDPFRYLGLPFIGAGMHGVLSPMAFVASLGRFVGANDYACYVFLIVGHFFLGAVGFYLLSKEVLEEQRWSRLGLTMVLFSGLGGMVFNQINVLLIFVPSVWFFYFYLHFKKHSQPSSLTGMALAALVMSVSYPPFHFLVAFAVVWLIAAMAYGDQVFQRMLHCAQALRRHKKVAFILLVLLMLGALTPVSTWLSSRSGENFFLARHAPILYGLDNGHGPSPKMTYTEIAARGTLGERWSLAPLLAHRGQFHYHADDFIYVPVVAYLLIVLGAVTTFDRRRFVLLFSGVILFLIALGSPGHLLEILYDAVPIFHYFRNQFYYAAFLVPLIILFACAQGKALADWLAKTSRPMALALVFGIHAAFLLFALQQPQVLAGTYATVVLSGLIFAAAALKAVRLSSPLVQAALVLMALVEPVQVFGMWRQQASQFHCDVPARPAAAQFVYRRPQGNDGVCPWLGLRDAQDFWHDMSLKDSDGAIIRFPDIVNKWAYLFYARTPSADYRNYVQSKFYLYDHEHGPGAGSSPGLPVMGPSPAFEVVGFDVNSIRIRSNFAQPTYAVYNDAYSRHWKAWLNDQPYSLVRANGAFKGMWLPAGPAELLLRYEPPLGAWPVVSFLVIIVALGLWTVGLCLKERTENDTA